MARIDYDPEFDEARLNRTAVAGIAIPTLVAAAALFVVPAMTDSLGITFSEAFWSVCAIEFVCAIVVAYSILNLHTYGS